jgi:esterase/lipase superfamily enzyme
MVEKRRPGDSTGIPDHLLRFVFAPVCAYLVREVSDPVIALEPISDMMATRRPGPHPEREPTITSAMRLPAETRPTQPPLHYRLQIKAHLVHGTGNLYAILTIIMLSFSFSGCSSTAPSFVDTVRKPPVTSFYVTDRNHRGLPGLSGIYGCDRDSVSYGIVTISIPARHCIGKIESASEAVDSTRHFTMLDHQMLDKESFFRKLDERRKNVSGRDILVYVHGYNTCFEFAVHNLTQIVSDIDFKGCPILFSWPSKDKLSRYMADELNVHWSQKNLRNFLKELALHTGTGRIYLLAHSMGNREMTGALVELIRENPQLKNRFKALIMSAADIDTMLFIRDIAPALASTEMIITLYVSRTDRALKLSESLHEYPRAGNSGYLPLILPGIETIDATDVDDSYLGHSYFSNSRAVLSDIYNIINNDLKADFRFSLQPVETPDGKKFWKFCK